MELKQKIATQENQIENLIEKWDDFQDKVNADMEINQDCITALSQNFSNLDERITEQLHFIHDQASMQ